MYQPVVKGIVTVPRCLCGGDVTLPNYFKDTYKSYVITSAMGPMDEQISARLSKFYLIYCATESAVCHAISKLR